MGSNLPAGERSGRNIGSRAQGDRTGLGKPKQLLLEDENKKGRAWGNLEVLGVRAFSVGSSVGRCGAAENGSGDWPGGRRRKERATGEVDKCPNEGQHITRRAKCWQGLWNENSCGPVVDRTPSIQEERVGRSNPVVLNLPSAVTF